MHCDDLVSKHLGSIVHEHRMRRTKISAQRSSQASQDCATQLVPNVTLTTTNVEDLITQTFCCRCELMFENHELLPEHYRTSSRHPDCPICFQVFRKKKALKKASYYQTRRFSH